MVFDLVCEDIETPIFDLGATKITLTCVNYINRLFSFFPFIGKLLL